MLLDDNGFHKRCVDCGDWIEPEQRNRRGTCLDCSTVNCSCGRLYSRVMPFCPSCRAENPKAARFDGERSPARSEER